jgi:Co/Zn/Cd efflux system component
MTVVARRPAPGLPLLIWLTIGIVGWVMVAWLAIQGISSNPPTAGFDLELVLRAGRDVAAGASAYDPAIVGGAPPEAVGLFYSYPPVVAQALAPFAAVPSGVMLLGWSVIAGAALFSVAERIRRALEPATLAGSTGLAAIAAGVLTFPFVVAILFGNLDAVFPALYGLALVAAVAPRPSDRALGGVAVAIASLAKLYPAGLGLWFAVRAVRDRGRAGAATTFVAIVTAVVALVAASLVVGGFVPWQDYVRVVAAAGRADLVDPRNVAPAAQIALLVGGDSDLARFIHVPVAALALIVTAWAAWTRRDPIEGLSIAAACSLLLLPVSWVHYPAALLPFGIAAAQRSSGRPRAGAIRGLLAASVAISIVALVWLPLLWAGVITLLAAVRLSAVDPSPGRAEAAA